MDRVVKVTDAKGNATTYTYDAAGRMLSMTTSNGGTWSYGYDNEGGRSPPPIPPADHYDPL